MRKIELSNAPTSMSKSSWPKPATKPPTVWPTPSAVRRRSSKKPSARATEEANKIIAAAKAEAEQAMVKGREALREQVAVLAVKGAEQILRKEVNASVHADLLKPSED
jgi:hypothetical protein